MHVQRDDRGKPLVCVKEEGGAVVGEAEVDRAVDGSQPEVGRQVQVRQRLVHVFVEAGHRLGPEGQPAVEVAQSSFRTYGGFRIQYRAVFVDHRFSLGLPDKMLAKRSLIAQGYLPGRSAVQAYATGQSFMGEGQLVVQAGLGQGRFGVAEAPGQGSRTHRCASEQKHDSQT